MATQCCRNPIGFVRANCTPLSALITNVDAILAAANVGPTAGLTCAQAISCINTAIANGQITKNDPNINAVSGSFDPASGTVTINLSNGGSFPIVQWPIDAVPLELNNGGAVPSPTELAAASVNKTPGQILWYGGTQENPDYAWIVSANGTYTEIESPAGAQHTTIIGDDATGFQLTDPNNNAFGIRIEDNIPNTGHKRLTIGGITADICPCPLAPVTIPDIAFANPAAPTSAEAEIWIAANNNFRPGQKYIKGGTDQTPDYVWENTNGLADSVIQIEDPGSVAALVPQPFQIAPVAQGATTGTPVPETADVYRTGTVLIGGADLAGIRSVGSFGGRPQVEVLGQFASGAGDHIVTGLNGAVAGGATNTASDDNTFVGGGVQNVADAIQSSVVGGFGNVASRFQSFIGGGISNSIPNPGNGHTGAIIGGQNNIVSNFRSVIAGGQNNVQNGQNALMTGDGNNNTGGSSIVGGSGNICSGNLSIISGDTNNNAGDASLVAGSMNVVDLNGDASIYAGVGNTWGGGRCIGAGDGNNLVGFGNIVAGLDNVVNGQQSLIIGETNNIAAMSNGLVVGDSNIVTSSARAIVAGITNNLNTAFSSIVGGQNNGVTAGQCLVSGSGNVVGIAVPVIGVSDCLVSGKDLNVGDGVFNSTALGVNSQLIHNNSFIFGAMAGSATPTIAPESFTFHGDGGARMLTDGAGLIGAELLPFATVWSAISLREKKTNIAQLTGALDKVNALGIYTFSYKDENGAAVRLKKKGIVQRSNSEIKAEANAKLAGMNRHGLTDETLAELDARQTRINALPATGTTPESGWVDAGRALEMCGPMADGVDGWKQVMGIGPDDQISAHDIASIAIAAIKELSSKLGTALARITVLEGA